MADYPDRPGYSFNPGPPPEVSRFFRNKGIRDSFGFEDVEPEEHAVAFAVAKATKADVLLDIRDAVQKAIDEGQTLDTFKRDLKPILQAKGWWGRKDMTDPLTGEIAEVQLGSPRRLRTIYNANLRSARAAGQWERIERTKKLLPFLEYRLGPSEVHRPAHQAKDGLILPVDDPFWDEWMPPNGWGCKCWVRQITRAEAERRGVSSPPKVVQTKYENTRTGEVQIVPAGIDPGWQRNPGRLRRQGMDAVLAQKLEKLPTDVAIAALRDIATSWRVRRIMDGAPGRAPVSILPDAVKADLGLPNRLVWVNSDSFKHIVRDHPGEDRKRYLDLLSLVPEAMQAAIEQTQHGPSLHLLLPFDPDWNQSGGAGDKRSRRPLHVILWFDDGVRVRTMLPATEDKFLRQLSRANVKRIDLDER